MQRVYKNREAACRECRNKINKKFREGRPIQISVKTEKDTERARIKSKEFREKHIGLDRMYKALSREGLSRSEENFKVISVVRLFKLLERQLITRQEAQVKFLGGEYVTEEHFKELYSEEPTFDNPCVVKVNTEEVT